MRSTRRGWYQAIWCLSSAPDASGIERIRAAAERERQQGRKLVLETDLELMATTAVAGGSG